MLVAAALELATEWGITGFAQGTGAAGVLACFNAWLEREGSGNREEQTILKNARDFLQTHGYGERFYNLAQDYLGNTDRNHAGYMHRAGGERDKPWFYLTDAAFETEICKGFDAKFVCEVLRRCGWLVSAEKDRVKTRLRWSGKGIGSDINQRFYLLVGDRPPGEYEHSGGEDG